MFNAHGVPGGKGWMLVPSASMFNHSCEPNTKACVCALGWASSGLHGHGDIRDLRAFLFCWVYLAPQVLVGASGLLSARSLCNISPGEELCISYVSPKLPLQMRRAKLQETYGFLCMCPRCVAEEAEAKAAGGAGGA